MDRTEDVKRLAALARISLSEEEAAAYAGEFDGILAYVSQLEKLELPQTGAAKPALYNVMREDGEPHETGKYTEKLTGAFPERDEDYLSVKQIISHD